MRHRRTKRYRPQLERFEDKKLLNASSHPAHAAGLRTSNAASHLMHTPIQTAPASDQPTSIAATAQTTGPGTALQMFRITNPSPKPLALIPPFNQVLVQPHAPTPGGTYNVLYVAVRNGTARTFTAETGLGVRISNGKTMYPVLTGSQVWNPGQIMVFYILTKQYYPMSPVTGGGFQFDLGHGQSAIAIPGPSGIYLRIKYIPGSFHRLLDWIVAHGPGSKGHAFGLPDTAVWQITSARTNIIPL